MNTDVSLKFTWSDIEAVIEEYVMNTFLEQFGHKGQGLTQNANTIKFEWNKDELRKIIDSGSNGINGSLSGSNCAAVEVWHEFKSERNRRFVPGLGIVEWPEAKDKEEE